MAEMSDESECRVAPNVVSILTNPLLIKAPVQGNLVRQYKQRFETLPEDIRVSKAGVFAGFMRKVSRGQHSVTIHAIELTGFGYAGSSREYTSPQDDGRYKSKEWIRGNTRTGPVLEVKDTCHLYHDGIEIKIIPRRTMDLNPGF